MLELKSTNIYRSLDAVIREYRIDRLRYYSNDLVRRPGAPAEDNQQIVSSESENEEVDREDDDSASNTDPRSNTDDDLQESDQQSGDETEQADVENSFAKLKQLISSYIYFLLIDNKKY